MQIHLIKTVFALFSGSDYLAEYYHYGGIIKQIMANPSGFGEGGKRSGIWPVTLGFELGDRPFFLDPLNTLTKEV